MLNRIREKILALFGVRPPTREEILTYPVNKQIAYFKASGYIPWEPGYTPYKWEQINQIINQESVLRDIREGLPLPDRYGWHLDERIIEYPWVMAHLLPRSGRLLDAGSALNFDSLTDILTSKHKETTIVTLAPERQAYWEKGISYHYTDIRNLPFQDSWFDEIVCLSTLEHIGLDNSHYIKDKDMSDGTLHDAISELWRVLKPGGQLLITVPYGQPQLVYWETWVQSGPFMKQFDRSMLDNLLSYLSAATIETDFFKYSNTGWQRSSQDECDEAEYFNIHRADGFDDDYAAAARAVACIVATK